MGLSAGLVGLPNVGKSTIFNALSTGKAAAENYPFCTIEPNQGIVPIPDKRLDRITAICPTQKIIPAYIELVDIAGLVEGASKGDGLGNKFLGHIKNVDAIIQVVRCFKDPDVVHVNTDIDPVGDATIIETELMLKDLETVDNGIQRLEKLSKRGDKEAIAKFPTFKKAKESLENGHSIFKTFKDDEEIEHLYELFLMTAKPVLYVANIDEDALLEENEYVKALKEYAASNHSICLPICGKTESEISELPAEERLEFLESIGMEEPGLDALSRNVYKILGLQTFFTSGPDENRAWTIAGGSTAQEAAGTIHTDFARGFIKAEVYTLEDLETYKKESEIRSAGKLRQEGREYKVQDGDIMFFKFNV